MGCFSLSHFCWSENLKFLHFNYFFEVYYVFLAPVQALLVVYQHSKRCQMSYIGHKGKKTSDFSAPNHCKDIKLFVYVPKIVCFLWIFFGLLNTSKSGEKYKKKQVSDV